MTLGNTLYAHTPVSVQYALWICLSHAEPQREAGKRMIKSCGAFHIWPIDIL